MICALMFITSNHNGINFLRNLLHLQCNIMFKVISDIMAHWNQIRYTIVIAISFCTVKKMICVLMYHKQSLWN